MYEGLGFRACGRTRTSAAQGSNDFQRIAKAIEDLDRSVPPAAVSAAASSDGAAVSRPVTAAVGKEVATPTG